MKTKVIFILLLIVLYYFNILGRENGLFQNFIITGVLNFLLTYYLLKTNPFRKVGLFLIFAPLLLLSLTILYGVANSLNMPGLLGFIMYVISTIFGVWLYKRFTPKIIIFYSIIFGFSIYQYQNLFNYYYFTVNNSKSIGQNFPNILLEDKNGKTSKIDVGKKVIVIDFWTLYCANCIGSFPRYEKVKQDYKNDKNVEFISVNIYQSKKEIAPSDKIVSRYTFTNYFSKNTLFEILDFNSVPNYLIVGKDGKVKYFGNLNVETLETYNNIYTLINNEK